MGATEDGKKELLAVLDGHRESKTSWQTVLRDLKRRGLSAAPHLAIGDGALGFWASLREEFPETREQRCWVHKTANILDKMPNSVQPDAKKLIHEMYLASTRRDAEASFKESRSGTRRSIPKRSNASGRTRTHSSRSMTSQWSIGSTSGAQTPSSRHLLLSAIEPGRPRVVAQEPRPWRWSPSSPWRPREWRRLNGHQLIAKVIEGVKFTNGKIEETAAA